MCAGCVTSGIEFATANGLVLSAGVRHSGRRILDRLRPSGDTPAARRARREAEVATFLEGLDLDPGPILGWAPLPEGVPAAPAAEALQPA